MAALLLLLAVAGGLAVAASAVPSLVAPEAPAVVPYPTVTGTLGEHLTELQKSVQP
jgi:hypothetical protein